MDILVIMAIVAELSRLLPGSRIDKVVEEADGSFRFSLRGKGVNHSLLINANMATPRVHLASRQSVPAEHPSPFHLFLKSRLTGGRIIAVLQEGLDRIVRIDIESGGPFEARRVSLVIEVLGRSANMIAVDESGIILACLQPAPPDDRHRGILPGLSYTPPPPQAGIPLSPALKKELPFMECPDDPAEMLQRVVFQPVVYPADGIHKALLSAIPLKSMGSRPFSAFPSMNEAADAFYAAKGVTSQNAMEGRLGHLIRRHLDKTRHTETAVRRELASWEDSQGYMLRGQTLLAWKDKVPKRADSIELPGPDGVPLSISLDPALSVPANAERYFKRYKKARRGVDACSSRLEKLSAEIEYLEGMLTAVDTADTGRDLAVIEEDLRREGYLKFRETVRKGGKKEPSFQPRKMDIEGWELWVGRSAGDNDTLLRHSAPDDLWLHAHKVPGSHVIIRNPARKKVPESVISRAAALAAHYSRARNEGKVEVIYCARKVVRKPPGARPGLVTVSEFRTVVAIAPFVLRD